MENVTPVSTHPPIRPCCEAPSDLPVEALSLPVLHGDMPREGIEQVDVAVGVVHHLPVELTDVEHLEQTARSRALRARQRRVRRQSLADLVVDLLDLQEERIAVVGDDVPALQKAR
jgi:hypothetical protein